MPWYIASYCGTFLISWLFQQLTVVLVLVVIGGVIALFSRFGGVLALVGSIVFVFTIRLPFSFYFTDGLTVIPDGLPCQGAYSIYGPYIFHVIGFWFALAGGILSLMGAAWTMGWKPKAFLKLGLMLKKSTKGTSKLHQPQGDLNRENSQQSRLRPSFKTMGSTSIRVQMIV